MIRFAGIAVLLFSVGCSAAPKITFTADSAITGNTIQRWQEGGQFRYGTFDDLIERFLAFPPPPPLVTVIPGTPGIPGTSGTPSTPGTPPTGPSPTVYNALLSFLNAGPSGGSITTAHLQQITPSFIALAQVYVNTPGISFNQLLNTPQAAAFINATQGILQSLGLWNYYTLNAWANYLGAYSVQSQIQSILTTFYSQITIPTTPGTPGIPGTPGTPGVPGNPDQIITTFINPLTVAQEIEDLRKSKDWLGLAEHGPGLVHSLIQHMGFSEPQGLIYGGRAGQYRPSILTTRRVGNNREAWVLNEEGFLINEQTSGASLFWQGEDDISLVYLPIVVDQGRVTVSDVVASDRYALLKRAAGGDLSLLDRASTHSTALLQADLAFGEKHNYHLRALFGTTPFSTMGGMMGEVEYGSGLFTGRLGGGVVAENSYSGTDDLLCYLETENVLRTPYLTIQQKGPEFKTWISATVAVSGLATRAFTRPTRYGKHVSQRWGYQYDARLVPEVHVELDAAYTKLSLYGGGTLALVPGGRVDLDVPEQSLGLFPIRTHVGGAVRLKISKLYASYEQDKKNEEAGRGIKEWWTDEEKQAHRDKFRMPPTEDWLFLQLEGVGEFSSIFHKARLGLSLEVYDVSAGFLTEFETYTNESFTDVRLGGGVSFRGFYFRGLTSVKDNNYLLSAGFEIIL